MTIRWPIEVLPPRDIAIDIAPRTLAAPSSVSGFSQVVASDAGIWKITYGSIPVVDARRVKTFRMLDVNLEGRLNPILVPINCPENPAYQPYPGDVSLYRQVPHSDLAFFSDGTGYMIDYVIRVVAAGFTAARSVTMDISIGEAGLIEPGQHFSIGERLYRIRSVTYTSGTAATITFRPPLREQVFGGWWLEFNNPICRMRLASDDQMQLGLEYNRWGFPSVSFIEDV